MPHEFVPRRDRNFAKGLRRDQTGVERELWHYLRANRLGGLRFKRQAPLGRYVVDFVCHEAKLIIELDGPHHESEAQAEHDRVRDTWLKASGYEVLRFSNAAVQRNILGVLTVIEGAVRSRGPLSQPSPARGEGFAPDLSDNISSSIDQSGIGTAAASEDHP